MEWDISIAITTGVVQYTTARKDWESAHVVEIQASGVLVFGAGSILTDLPVGLYVEKMKKTVAKNSGNQ